MIHYCVEVWGGKEISKNVYWPIFGSSEDWVRQTLNIWVNSKEPISPEESEYAKIWVFRPEVYIFKLTEENKELDKKKEKKGKGDEIIIVPPPYVPPPPPPVPNAPVPPPQSNDSDSDQSDYRSPITRSRTKEQQTGLFPLREMPMGVRRQE